MCEHIGIRKSVIKFDKSCDEFNWNIAGCDLSNKACYDSRSFTRQTAIKYFFTLNTEVACRLVKAIWSRLRGLRSSLLASYSCSDNYSAMRPPSPSSSSSSSSTTWYVHDSLSTFGWVLAISKPVMNDNPHRQLISIGPHISNLWVQLWVYLFTSWSDLSSQIF